MQEQPLALPNQRRQPQSTEPAHAPGASWLTIFTRTSIFITTLPYFCRDYITQFHNSMGGVVERGIVEPLTAKATATNSVMRGNQWKRPPFCYQVPSYLQFLPLDLFHCEKKNWRAEIGVKSIHTLEAATARKKRPYDRQVTRPDTSSWVRA